MKNCYVYSLVDTFTNKPFYIGMAIERKNRDKSRYREHLQKVQSGSTSHVHRKIRQLHAEGKAIEFRILREDLTYEEAMIIERDWIASIGLDNLTNTTLGGHDGRWKKWKDASSEVKVAFSKKCREGQKCRKVQIEKEETSETGVFDSTTLAANFLETTPEHIRTGAHNGHKVKGWSVKFLN